MATFLLRRLLWCIPVLGLSTAVALSLANATPGGPFDSNPDYRQLSRGAEQLLRDRFGMDLPLWHRFTRYLLFDIEVGPDGTQRFFCGAICGDFGVTYSSRGTRTVQSYLFEPLVEGGLSRFGYSLRLGLQAICVALGFGLPLGFLAALRQNSWLDHALTTMSTLFFAVPPLFTGLFALIVVAGRLDLVRTIPDWNEPIRPWVLPTLVLGLSASAFVARLTRVGVLEVRRSEFVTTARAKGLHDHVVATRHILRVAVLPLVALTGPFVAGTLTGSITIEAIFQVPGLGAAYVHSITRRDVPVLLTLNLIYTVFLVAGNLLGDLLLFAFDPRVRRG